MSKDLGLKAYKRVKVSDLTADHTAKVTMETIKKNRFLVISPDNWPANSHDLYPLDYFFLE